MDREPMKRPTIRAALVLGFGLVLGTWLSVSYYFTRRIADVERQASDINARYVTAQDLLSTVRTQVLLGSLYVRDALLDPDPALADDYRRRLEESYQAVDTSLQQYVPALDSSAERDRVMRLREEIDDFRGAMLNVLETDPRPADARTLLRERVAPRRQFVIDLSEQTQALNRSAFVEQQAAIVEIYRTTQRRIWQSLGAALTTSLAIALLAIMYAGRLEDRVQRQRERELQTAQELQQLSARLVQVQEDERRGIARELHDGIGQALTAIKVELAVAERAIEGAGGAANALGNIRSITDGVLRDVRDLSHLIHPALLDDIGLVAATEWYLRGFAGRHGLRADLLHDRLDERLPPDVEAAAYRIVQEALTNVARHARATTCRVYLQKLSTTLLVTVEDDGVGFDAARPRPTDGRGGLGLISIRERATRLDGTVRVETGPDKGTRLTVELGIRATGTADSRPAAQAVILSPAHAREVAGG